MSKRSFRVALAVVVGSVLLVVAIAGWFIHRALQYPDAQHEGSGGEIDVEIKPGMSFPQVASMLSSKGVIDRPTWFRIYAMWEGDTTNIKTGKYLIKDNLTPAQVLKVLVTGIKEVTTKVTLPEGKNMLEFFDLLGTSRVANPKELEAIARDKEFLSNHAITGDSVEGYLFPDTYEFRVGEKPRVVIERLINRHQEVWQELLAKHGRDAGKLKDKLHWGDREILTMASIVEKEAVDPAERPRIAQVFINRLTSPDFKPKRLETDPTIRYGCEVPVQKSAACRAWNKSDRLHTAQLHDADNPYNTYQHEGLPPGPISNPGKGSMEATLAPDGSEYLYFVARDARNHAFARTYDEHKRNVERFQK
ncbi:MAG: aminodeoxychorismate lyase [Myxococcales bacterium]|nr:aminodeoxychorismate lyase [Myxococcales bacterium]